MKTTNFKKFAEMPLNNAQLLVYKTYMQDLSDFETLYRQSDENIEVFLRKCKDLETSENPEAKLKEIIKT